MNILFSKKQEVLEAEEMGKCEDLSEFGKDQTEMARRASIKRIQGRDCCEPETHIGSEGWSNQTDQLL